MTTLVDTGFVVALLNRRDTHHEWAVAAAERCPRPWHTCEPVLTEAFYLLGEPGVVHLATFIRRQAMLISFNIANHCDPVFDLMAKYAEAPMSLADACLVRMSEVVASPLVLTTDRQFKIYRRHNRQTIPSMMPH